MSLVDSLVSRRRRIWAGAAAAGLALALGAAALAWHLRLDALEGQERELDLLAAALTAEIDRGLQGVQEGMRALQTELEDGRLPLRGPGAEAALKTRADLMPLVTNLWLVDAQWQPLAASDPLAVPPRTGFAPALQAPPGAAAAGGTTGAEAMSIGRPYVDPSDGTPLVVVAVRYAAPAAAAGPATQGWVLAGIPARLLLGAEGATGPAPDVRLALFRDDGVTLAGEIVAGRTPDEARVALRLARSAIRPVHRFVDGTERLVAVRATPHAALKLVLTRDLDAVLGAWRETARFAAAAVALVLALLAAAVALVERANDRHRQAQAALDAQASRASRLESLGALAGGVSHDFNNVLAAIIGFGEMARDAATDGSAQARHLDKVLQSAQRGKALVERILSFSRGGARTSVVFEFSAVVEEVLGMLAASLPPGLVIERDLRPEGGRLQGDPTQAFEAVMNLCTNALQAMPGGGMLTVRLDRVTLAAPRVLSHSRAAPGAYLRLSVSDQGPGIRPEVMEHLFEPFFTTRKAEAGTGLGLAVVHGVVAELRGAIDVQTTLGQGTSFVLYLPECTAPLSAAGTGADAPAVGRGQPVLVVDDEPALVEMALEWLTGLGYQPVGFTDPAAALQALRDEPARFAAVVTDEVMPGLSGTQLAAEIRAFAPALPVLMVSGYGGAALAERALAAGVTLRLSKPLHRAELARALADHVA